MEAILNWLLVEDRILGIVLFLMAIGECVCCLYLFILNDYKSLN